MSIFSQGASVPITSVKLNGTTTIHNSVVPTLVKQPPSGAVIFDDLPPPPADGSGLPVFYGGFSPFTGTMTVPNTSFLLEHSSLQGGLTPGQWKFTVNDFAQECSQVSNCTGGGATDTYDIQVYLKPGVAPATGTVDFAFYFVGGPVTFAAAPTNASFQRMLSSLAQIYASAGICIGKVTLYDMQPWVKSSPDFGGNINADPLFVAAPRDIHLSAGSPAIDTGTCTGAPATDFEGDPRPTGAGCDMGADEFVP